MDKLKINNDEKVVADEGSSTQENNLTDRFKSI